jgi:DNA-directed RNA polymerase subunit RPC12/RpoP
MSEEKQLPKLICRKCNQEMTPTGRVMHLEYPKTKELLNYREFECVNCKYKITIGGA